LSEYHGPVAYRRKAGKICDARFAYNHIVNPQMLLWLIEATGVDLGLVSAARCSSVEASTMHQQSAAIRKDVPWEMVAQALWKQH
jgi:hypothetical protein